MTPAAGHQKPEGDRPSELEQLGDELSRRGMHTTLAPGDEDEGPVLEAISPRPTGIGLAVTGMRVWFRNGAFWWAGGEELGSGTDISRAADRVAAALQWSRQALRLPDPHPEPGST